MVHGLDPSAERFLTDLLRISRRVERAQRDIASGLRIVNVSDDPDQISDILRTRAEISGVQQMRVNLGRVQMEVDAAESGLRTAVSIIERAQVIGAQGLNGTATNEMRQALAGEVENLITQLVAIADTHVAGRYIFAGDADRNVPYTLDWTTSPDDPVGDYAGAAATRQTLHPSGVPFSIAISAREIFDSAVPEKNVFDNVNALRLALKNNDEGAMRSVMANLKQAEDHLNGMLSSYGAFQNQVAEAADAAAKKEVRLKGELTTLQEADLTEAIIELQQSKFQQEAALTSRAQMPRTSLFDYLR